MTKFEFFRSSQITTDCDQCSGRVDLLKGGVCIRCRRILCYRHLHGSWVRRLIAEAPDHLGAGNFLLMEIGATQEKAVRELQKVIGPVDGSVPGVNFHQVCRQFPTKDLYGR